MDKVSAYVNRFVIPTYLEPKAENLPMFAENRVHQRSSGRPYPNKVVLKVNREEKVDKEYEVVTLENKYLKIEILPEIGGRIYSALDKTTGYDFFYKQHVIKPALIGVLGSWISGGVEFNWPFHHRASGFMPCDYTIEECEDGTKICWLSEHDPIDRMKGMVGIVLKPDTKYFETRMKLYNRTDTPRSFLWWENAAVPVHEQYQIFFPEDVTYVNFHYLKSRITYPIAGNGVFNGIPMQEDRDISMHKNTVPATSYFASASDYDFFGGYDHAKQCGVVHIGDHHVSPGKKMFTWGYCQLAKSWENALTDEDGQYAELMAGSYSDNQPNFSWLEAYESKEFSQFWYPISQIGTPEFANLKCAFKIYRGEENTFKIQSTEGYKNVTISISSDEKELFCANCDLVPETAASFKLPKIPQFVEISVVADGEEIGYYKEQKYDEFNMPEPITDMPSAAGMNNADELYLAGVHVDQYRDPAVMPDSYWKEALKRDINHVPSLIAMAKYEYGRYSFAEAEKYIVRAINRLNLFNERHKSGEAYYVYGQILEATGDFKKAEDYYNKSAWAADSVSKAMTRIALLDIRKKDYRNAARHALTALKYGNENMLAVAAYYIATHNKIYLGDGLKKDPLNHMLRYLADASDFIEIMDSNPAETCLDVCFDLALMGRYEDIICILEKLLDKKPSCAEPMVLYTLGYYKKLVGQAYNEFYKQAEVAEIGATYPVRLQEMQILESVIEETGSKKAKLLLGCLLYNKRHYKSAAKLWEACDDYISVRNLAVAYFSHLDRKAEALSLMRRAIEMQPNEEQLVYETVVLMNKLGTPAAEKIEFLTSKKLTRDDCLTELAKAYNQNLQHEKAIEVLMSHDFVPCEGGEHAIADQYLFAHLCLGKQAMNNGNLESAIGLFRKGQVLPQSLGAGIWNHCKLVPLKYYEALCLEQAGKKADADEIFRYIATIEIEYFSNMHLKELPYYQANSWLHLGEGLKARNLITKFSREWETIKDTKDNGFFGTTPFFISFTDDPKELRKAQYLYLTALCDAFMGNEETAVNKLKKSVMKNSENLYALFFSMGI